MSSDRGNAAPILQGLAAFVLGLILVRAWNLPGEVEALAKTLGTLQATVETVEQKVEQHAQLVTKVQQEVLLLTLNERCQNRHPGAECADILRLGATTANLDNLTISFTSDVPQFLAALPAETKEQFPPFEPLFPQWEVPSVEEQM